MGTENPPSQPDAPAQPPAADTSHADLIRKLQAELAAKLAQKRTET